MPVERIWTDKVLISMTETVDRLRRMRTAAVCDAQSIGFRFRRRIHEMLYTPQEIRTGDIALKDAKILADAASDYFSERLIGDPIAPKQYSTWQYILKSTTSRYDFFRASSSSSTPTTESVRYMLIPRLRNIHIDPDYMMEWDFCVNNKLTDTLENLLHRNIGIYAPLSGDYLIAKTYTQYLLKKYGKVLDVQAMALSSSLSIAKLLRGTDNRIPFESKDEIGIFIDSTETGKTALAAYSSIRNTYPDKIVHEPRLTRRDEFVMSQKMEDYWKDEH